MGGRQAVFACSVVAFAFVTYLFGLIAHADGWPARKVLESVIRVSVEIQGSSGTCTAFSVDQQRGQFITAGHCAKGPMSLGHIAFAPLDENTEADLALVQASQGGLPALKLGGEPRTGDATLSVGYPLSSPKPMLIPSLYQGQFDAWNDGGNFAIFSGNPMVGMSGGPIVNTRGEVVSVVLGGGNPSQAFQNVGFGTPYQALRRILLKQRTN